MADKGIMVSKNVKTGKVTIGPAPHLGQPAEPVPKGINQEKLKQVLFDKGIIGSKGEVE